jgi:hypothetical protein
VSGSRVVRRIDHLFIAVEGARHVFEMLRSRLGLVPLFPVADWGVFTSGGFNLGNTFLEILESQPGFPTAASDALEVKGIAFEPVGTAESLSEVERRGIPLVPPFQVVAPDHELPPFDLAPPFGGSSAWPAGSPLFTNLIMPGFAADNVAVFCCGYEAAIPVATVREGMRRKLDRMPDRGLPIDAVTQVVVGATDFAAERRRWQGLLDPIVDEEPGVWDFGDGPALRLVDHDRDAVVGLVLHVDDLEQAERYLKERDMLVSLSGDELVVSPEALEGLSLTLVG